METCVVVVVVVILMVNSAPMPFEYNLAFIFYAIQGDDVSLFTFWCVFLGPEP